MTSVLNVTIYSPFSEFPAEKRYDPNIKISELKEKLELVTGANHKTMKIGLAVDDKQLGELDNNDLTLSHYLGDLLGKVSSAKLTVTDEQTKELADEDVPKYTISEEKYLERPNNARNFIKELKGSQKSGQ